jgi:CheY-like chemotaxis protein
MRQVLINLVGNAIKFTHFGEVVVSVSIAAEHDSRCTRYEVDADSENESATDELSESRPVLDSSRVALQIVVRDTGLGIAEEQQAKIFEEFEQADGSVARMFGGTGLGLAITRGLVALMGGHVELESEVDAGSTFTFFVPVVIGTELDLSADDSSVTELDEQTVSRIQGLRVLVVDDNATNQVLMRGLLQKQGVTVSIADSGEAALEQVQQNAFDVVLMDVEMPGMDGFETTQRIREQEDQVEGRLPIFALTAHTLPHYGLRCLSAGMDGYLTKPLNVSQLIAIIERVALP